MYSFIDIPNEEKMVSSYQEASSSPKITKITIGSSEGSILAYLHVYDSTADFRMVCAESMLLLLDLVHQNPGFMTSVDLIIPSCVFSLTTESAEFLGDPKKTIPVTSPSPSGDGNAQSYQSPANFGGRDAAKTRHSKLNTLEDESNCIVSVDAQHVVQRRNHDPPSTSHTLHSDSLTAKASRFIVEITRRLRNMNEQIKSLYIKVAEDGQWLSVTDSGSMSLLGDILTAKSHYTELKLSGKIGDGLIDRLTKGLYHNQTLTSLEWKIQCPDLLMMPDIPTTNGLFASLNHERYSFKKETFDALIDSLITCCSLRVLNLDWNTAIESTHPLSYYAKLMSNLPKLESFTTRIRRGYNEQHILDFCTGLQENGTLSDVSIKFSGSSPFQHANMVLRSSFGQDHAMRDIEIRKMPLPERGADLDCILSWQTRNLAANTLSIWYSGFLENIEQRDEADTFWAKLIWGTLVNMTVLSFSFEATAIGQKTLDAMTRVLRSKTVLRCLTLILRDIHSLTRCPRDLLVALQENQTLEAIKLDGLDIAGDSWCAQEIACLLGRNVTLERLALDYCGQADIETCHTWLQALTENRTLTHVRLLPSFPQGISQDVGLWQKFYELTKRNFTLLALNAPWDNCQQRHRGAATIFDSSPFTFVKRNQSVLMKQKRLQKQFWLNLRSRGQFFGTNTRLDWFCV